MAKPNCCFMIIAATSFFLQPIAEGNCDLLTGQANSAKKYRFITYFIFEKKEDRPAFFQLSIKLVATKCQPDQNLRTYSVFQIVLDPTCNTGKKVQ